jgi:hypothetical protein
MLRSEVISQRNLPFHGRLHFRVAVTQNQSPMPAEVIYVLVAIDIPLARARCPLDIERIRP